MLMSLLSLNLACREGTETKYVVVDAGAPLVRDLPQDEADIPCAPRHVLKTICQRCHTKPAQNGAPFPLINRSDVVERVYGDVVVRELMIEEITAGRMPLTPVTISEEEKETLLGWLRADAPAEHHETCPVDAGAEDAQ